MRNFCTLFDSNYLIRGLALYKSLQKNLKDFHMYIYAFDEIAYNVLVRLNLEQATIIALKEFEDEELLKVKETRTKGEYCWTCTPAIISHTIKKYTLSECIYLDSDIYFFSNPEMLIKEVENSKKDVLITEHRYTKEYNQECTSGKYCVQFMYFKNSQQGLEVLNWWKERCLEWCYAHFEDGKFGDQKYLDDWLERFPCVHSLENLGGGVAPWNVQQYYITNKNSLIVGRTKNKQEEFNLIFYHFHGLKLYSNFKHLARCYRLDKDVKDCIYQEYIKTIMLIYLEIKKQFPHIQFDLVELTILQKIKLLAVDMKIMLGKYLRGNNG